MNPIVTRNILALLALVLCSGCAAPGAPAPAPAAGAGAAGAAAPAAPTPNLCDFLGVTDAVKALEACKVEVCKCLQQQFPEAAGPPILGEVGEDASPAVACAAKMAAEEAKAPQKIVAIRYLGRMGCTKCYPCVEAGLLAALDDCTEEVRYEAVKALRYSADGTCKSCCQTDAKSCCTKNVFDKLQKVAYESDKTNSPIEPSARVRRVARQVLAMCGTPRPTESPEPTPAEGPSDADDTTAKPTPPEDAEKTGDTEEKDQAAPAAADAKQTPPSEATTSATNTAKSPSSAALAMADTAKPAAESDVKRLPPTDETADKASATLKLDPPQQPGLDGPPRLVQQPQQSGGKNNTVRFKPADGQNTSLQLKAVSP